MLAPHCRNKGYVPVMLFQRTVSSMATIGVKPTPPLIKTSGRSLSVSSVKEPAGAVTSRTVPTSAWWCDQVETTPAGFPQFVLTLDRNSVVWLTRCGRDCNDDYDNRLHLRVLPERDILTGLISGNFAAVLRDQIKGSDNGAFFQLTVNDKIAVSAPAAGLVRGLLVHIRFNANEDIGNSRKLRPRPR